MKRTLAAATSLLLLAVPAVHATQISVSSGQTLIFSFDFTAAGSVPPPPYPDMRVQTGLEWSSFDFDDVCRYTFYGDVGGRDQGTSIGSCGIDTFESALEESGWLDGLLSIGLTVISGSIIVDPVAIAFDGFGLDGQRMTSAVTPTVRAVTEPWSLALLALGLVLMPGRRRPAARSARHGARASEPPTPGAAQ